MDTKLNENIRKLVQIYKLEHITRFTAERDELFGDKWDELYEQRKNHIEALRWYFSLEADELTEEN
jgi:hypothetical protein